VAASDGGVARPSARRLDDVTPRPIAGTDGARNPFFSPDGRALAFFADRKVRRVPLEGGAPVDVCEIGSNQRGGAWAAGTIVLAPTQTSPLLRVPDSGGKPVPLTTLDVARGEASHRWPEVLPGGKWVLFSVGFEGTSYDDGRVDAVSLETGERRVVLSGGAFARWVPGGRLVFARGGQLYAIRFDPKTLKTSGPPEPVISGVRHDPQNGAAHVAVSASGTLVYGPGVPFSPEVYLAWLAPGAAPVRLSDTPRAFRDPRLSPDGERIAAAVGPASESDLWIVDARGGTMTRLSFGLSPRRPTWTPDGRRIAVGVEKDGAFAIVTVPADGNGAAATLLSRTNRVQPCAFSNDGRLLVFQERRAETGWDLFVLALDAAGKPEGAPRALAASPFQESNAALSRDGRWLAYESDEVDNLVQAHVVSFPDGAVKVRASSSGARHPAWGPRGELYYWDTSMHRLAVSETRADGGTLRVEPPRSVFGEGPRPAALAHVVITVTGGRYDVAPSGERFLVLETSNPSVEPAFTRPVIVQRFADALARKADTR
jgi:serine/threonine-protein kinase